MTRLENKLFKIKTIEINKYFVKASLLNLYSDYMIKHLERQKIKIWAPKKIEIFSFLNFIYNSRCIAIVIDDVVEVITS